jgi:hypothetical protein
METRASDDTSRAGPGMTATVAKTTEISITNGFSIGVDDIYKDVIGVGIYFESKYL